MLTDDGRVISNFIVQALTKKPLTIYGDGSQTRSFCFVDDMVDGLISLMNSSTSGPINLGNPEEFSILEIGKLISLKLNIDRDFIFEKLPQDDPLQRKPLIDLAKKELNWEPKISINKGLDITISYFQNQLIKSNL